MQQLMKYILVSTLAVAMGTSSCLDEKHVALVQRQASKVLEAQSECQASVDSSWTFWDSSYGKNGLPRYKDTSTDTFWQLQSNGMYCTLTTSPCQGLVDSSWTLWDSTYGKDALPRYRDTSTGTFWQQQSNGLYCSYTASPTGLPTASPMATAVGDPHLVNTRGDHFTIFKSGQVEFIRVPYESVTEEADLTVHATIQSFGGTDKCKESLYITGLRFGGSWFNGKPLEVNVDFISPESTTKEMKVLLGSVPVLPSTDPIDVGAKMTLHMHDNQKIVLMVDGASVAVDQQNFFLNVKADAFSKLSQKIGGLLGEDDHSAFSTKPAGCEHEFLLAKAAKPVYSSASMSA